MINKFKKFIPEILVQMQINKNYQFFKKLRPRLNMGSGRFRHF